MARIKVFDTTTQSWVYADKSFGKDGESITITNITESNESNGNNVVTFSDGNKLNIKNGKDGINGVSPTVSVNKSNGVSTVSITDKNGTKTATINDGNDGVSPTLSVSKSGKVTTISIADKNGTKTATINDGDNGENGKDGTSVTVQSVSESAADGGSNVVTFSDGKTLTVKNGSKGNDATSITHSWNGTTLSITSASGTSSVDLKGATGSTPQISIGTVFTVNEDSNAAVTIGGTPENPVLNFTIPRGIPVREVDYFTVADQEYIVQRVIAALGTPVFGRVDADKNIILTGELVEGTYTLKYEDAEGEQTTIGTLEHTITPLPSYTNVLLQAVNSDETPFVGTNGEKGYKTNTRLSSTGAESTTNATGLEVTGFIKVEYGNILRFKNLTINKDSANKAYCYFALYDSSFTKLSNGVVRLDQFAETAYTKGLIKLDENNNLTEFTIGYETFPHIPDTSAVAYIRCSADEINDSSIITINQEID